jgi:1-acyl-sn-glycerol-3-phosphate acyltransferase
MRYLGVLKYNIQGLEKLDRKGLLILANHPTLIDTVFLMAFVKYADCIVKSTLWRNPFTHGPVRAAGYICNNHGPDLIKDCIASINNSNNLIIFPEGTRTELGGMIKFKRGAAHIALLSQHKITPIVIQCAPSTLTKGEKWWHVPPSIACFSIVIKEDINIQNFISARELNSYLVNYFMNLTKESDSFATT